MGIFDFFSGGRKNEEQNINSSNSHDMLLNNFRSENWGKLSFDEKRQLLQRVENETALAEGRMVRTVNVEAMEPNVYGYFNEYTSPNEVHINRNLLNNSKSGYDALSTLWHEGRHAYQYDAYTGKLYDENNRPDKATEELWRANFDNDIYRNKGIDYYGQPIEKDANQFARDKMNENAHVFRGDPEFENHIKGISDNQRRYEELASASMYGSAELHESMLADEILSEYQEKVERQKADANKTLGVEGMEKQKSISGGMTDFLVQHSDSVMKGASIASGIGTLVGGVTGAMTESNSPNILDGYIHPETSQVVQADESMNNSLNDILNDMGYEISENEQGKRSDAENAIIDVGQAVDSIGSGEDAALNSTEEKSQEIKEDMEAATLDNNTPKIDRDIDSETEEKPQEAKPEEEQPKGEQSQEEKPQEVTPEKEQPKEEQSQEERPQESKPEEEQPKEEKSREEKPQEDELEQEKGKGKASEESNDYYNGIGY